MEVVKVLLEKKVGEFCLSTLTVPELRLTTQQVIWYRAQARPFKVTQFGILIHVRFAD